MSDERNPAELAEALRRTLEIQRQARLNMMDDEQRVYFGVYTCHVCDKRYMVNDAWAPCTPDTCHECLERFTRNPAND